MIPYASGVMLSTASAPQGPWWFGSTLLLAGTILGGLLVMIKEWLSGSQERRHARADNRLAVCIEYLSLVRQADHGAKIVRGLLAASTDAGHASPELERRFVLQVDAFGDVTSRMNDVLARLELTAPDAVVLAGRELQKLLKLRTDLSAPQIDEKAWDVALTKFRRTVMQDVK